MFSKDITEHDAFLEMPLSTQALYFHLGMQADDDGFVSPNRVLRMIGCQADDLKILIAKKYILQFDDGVIVIKHWKINNYLRSDRYKTSTHTEKKELLTLKNNGSYSWYTTGIPTGIPVVDAGKVRIGKDSILSEQSSEELKSKQIENMPFNKYSDDYEEEVQVDPDYQPVKKNTEKAADDIQQVFDLFDNPAKKVWRLRKIEREAAKVLFETYGIETLKKRMQRIKAEAENGDPLFPLIVTPSQLLDKMPNVERYLKI